MLNNNNITEHLSSDAIYVNFTLSLSACKASEHVDGDAVDLEGLSQ